MPSNLSSDIQARDKAVYQAEWDGRGPLFWGVARLGTLRRLVESCQAVADRRAVKTAEGRYTVPAASIDANTETSGGPDIPMELMTSAT